VGRPTRHALTQLLIGTSNQHELLPVDRGSLKHPIDPATHVDVPAIDVLKTDPKIDGLRGDY
jgi:hypothetical protein